MYYAVIQKNLGQKIDMKTLEEASVHVPSVARADCARISRQLFGVVVTGLPKEEAIAFETALAHFGFPTEVIEQRRLPALPAPKFRRGIRFEQDRFVAIDGMGREDAHPWEELQFAAGGFLDSIKMGKENKLRWAHNFGGQGAEGKIVEVVKVETEMKQKEFRMELFLSCEPYRLQFQAGEDTVFRYDTAFLRFRQADQFNLILQRIAGVLPADCVSLGIQAAHRGETFTYPGASAFEEEIVWHLFQRLRG